MARKPPPPTTEFLTLEERILAALRDQKVMDFVPTWESVLRENVGRADERARRLFVTLLGLILAFVLADSGTLEEVEFAGLRLKALTQLLRWIPLLLAYFLTDLTSALNLRHLYARSHFLLLLKTHGPLADHDLHELLIPPSQIAFLDFLTQGDRPRWQQRIMNMAKVFVMTCAFAPVAFIVYAFVRCFARHGIADILTWVSVALTLAGLFFSLLAFALANRWHLVPGRGFVREGIRSLLLVLWLPDGRPVMANVAWLVGYTHEQRQMLSQIAADQLDPLHDRARLALTMLRDIEAASESGEKPQ